MFGRTISQAASMAASFYCFFFVGSVYGQQPGACDFYDLVQKAQLATATYVKLHVDDQITDGCWPSPDTAKTVIELVLLKNEINTNPPENALAPVLAIHGLGYGSDGQLCIAHISLSLHKYVSTIVPFSKPSDGGEFVRSLEWLEVWGRDSVLSGGKTGFQSRIKNFFEESAEALVLAYRKAQIDTFERCPRIKDSIEALATSSR